MLLAVPLLMVLFLASFVGWRCRRAVLWVEKQEYENAKNRLMVTVGVWFAFTLFKSDLPPLFR